MTRLAFQNIHERIDKLRAHLKSRRGRLDRCALQRLAELRKYLENRTTCAKVDDLLRSYYDLENDLPLYRENPFFAMLTKDENCPPNRVYVVPVSFLPDKEPDR